MKRWFAIFVAVSMGLIASAPAGAQDRLRIAYIPILPSAHEFIAAAKGWYQELGLPIDEVPFNSGPPIGQAMAAGNIDVAYVGTGPAMAAVVRGTKAKVLAAAMTDSVAAVASESFAEIFDKSPNRAAFQKFLAMTGRRLRIATLPANSTPHVMLLYWLRQMQIDFTKEVEIVAMGENQVYQAALSQQVDATMIVEPIITLMRKSTTPFRVIAYGKDILNGQPGSVLFVRQNILAEKPALAEKLVLLQLRATRVLLEDRDEAARIVSRKIGSDRIAVDIVRSALDSPAVRWVVNPRTIVDGMFAYNRFQVSMGLSRSRITAEDFFDFRFYDRVVKANPQFSK